jgi:ABC-type Mn2+/Zn2+ transport system ATPase subunit
VNAPLIRFEKADLGYGRRAVLRDVNMEIRRGESVGLVGPNGCGKTTFLRSVLGLIPSLGGRLERDRSARFAYVPQADEMNLLWPLRVRDVVELPARARRRFGRATAADRAAADAALRRAGAADIAERLMREVSGGQRQRAAIAQAIAQAPDVILFDEPTKGLDVVAERDLLGLIAGLAEEGRTLFLVSHSLAIPLNLSRRVLLFHDGRVVDSTPEEILTSHRLEDVYGVPFGHAEQDGQRWVYPRGDAR